MNNDVQLKEESQSSDFLKDLLSDEHVEVMELEEIPEYERVYKSGNVYAEDYRNFFTESFPLDLQNNLYVQKRISAYVADLVAMIGDVRVGLDYDYPIKRDFKSERFAVPWIIPVVNDVQVKYYQLEQLDDESDVKIELDKEEGQTEEQTAKILPKKGVQKKTVKKVENLEEQPSDIKEINFTDQMIALSEVYTKYLKNNINYEQFFAQTYDLTNPFLPDLEKKGYKMTLRANTELLRHSHIEDTNWRIRRGLGEMSIPYDVLDEHKVIKKTEKRMLIKGEEVAIVGFLFVNKEADIRQGFQELGIIIDIEYEEKATKLVIKRTTAPKEPKKTENSLRAGDEIVFFGDVHTVLSMEEGPDDNLTVLIGRIAQKMKKEDIIQKTHVYMKRCLEYDVVRLSKDLKITRKFLFDRNLLVLFDNMTISKSEFPQIIDAIFPTYHELVQSQANNPAILRNYAIDVNMLEKEDYSMIAEQLKTKIAELSAIKPFKVQNAKGLTDFDGTIYDNRYIFDNGIIAKYGLYPLKEKSDSLMKRAVWVFNRKDFGDYYYNYVQEKILAESKQDITPLLREVEKYVASINKQYDGEKKVDAFFDKCRKYVVEYADVGQMGKDTHIYKDGEIALVRGAKELYEWTKGKWTLLRKVVDISDLPCLCKFNGVDPADLKDVPCEFTSIGCRSLKIARLEQRKKFADQVLEGLLKVNPKDSVQQVKEKLATIGQYWRREESIGGPATDAEKSTKISESSIPDELQYLIAGMEYIFEPALRQLIMYKIIDLDGLLINGWIYSRKYGVRLFCGHNTYLQKIAYAGTSTKSTTIRSALYEKMKYEYGDDGATDHSAFICRICGQRLDHVKYDDSTGFDDEGKLVVIAEKWVDEKQAVQAKLRAKESDFDWRNIEFETELKMLGYTQDQINRALIYCGIAETFASILSIQLDKPAYVSILRSILTEIIPSQLDCKKYYLAKMKSSGKDMEFIKRLDEQGEFVFLCQRLTQLKQFSLVSARLIIYLETAVPAIRVKPKVKCGTADLVELFACMVEERKLITIVKRDGKKVVIRREDISGDITRWLEKLKRNFEIRQLYASRDQLRAIVQEQRQEQRQLQRHEIVHKPIEAIEDRGTDRTRDFVNHRLKYVIQEIIRTLEKSVREGQLIDSNSRAVMNGCCSYQVSAPVSAKYLTSLKDTITPLITDAQKLAHEWRRFLNKGQISRAEITFSRINAIGNRPVIDYLDDSIINGIFQLYCWDGETKGERHVFVGGECIKCAKKLTEIRATKFSKEEFAGLIESIIEGNKHVFGEEIAIVQPEDLPIVKAEQKPAKNLESFITDFVDRLLRITGKLGQQDRYIGLLRALGDYDNTYSGGTTPMEIIKLINSRESNRVALLKTYINRYFRTYISLLSNYDDLEKVQQRLPEFMCDFREDIKKCIIDDYITVGQYISADNMEIFRQLRFRYSISDINAIIGRQDRYNCGWEKVIKESPFTLANASEILLYVLVSELNRFVEESSSKKGKAVIANFIITVFDMIMADNTVYNMARADLDRYKNLIYQTEYTVYKNRISERTLSEIETFGDITAEEMMENREKDVEETKKEADEDAFVEGLARDKYGPEASPDMIEAFKEAYYKDKRAQDQAIRDQFDYKDVAEDDNEEVVEEGDDYSELPQEHGASDS